MTNQIPMIANPCYETWIEFADSGMWAELRESLNLFHDLHPDHPVWQVEASTKSYCEGSGADFFPNDLNKRIVRITPS